MERAKEQESVVEQVQKKQQDESKSVYPPFDYSWKHLRGLAKQLVFGKEVGMVL